MIESFQRRVHRWIVTCFGTKGARNRRERNHRFLEEALELVQACGCTHSEAHQLVNYVFGRRIGDPFQEVGGVRNTLAALCTAHGIDDDSAAEAELIRVWGKVEEIRAKNLAKPLHSPLPGYAEPMGSLQNENLGKWLSAALDDPLVCSEMKSDIEAWFLWVRPGTSEDVGHEWVRSTLGHGESICRHCRITNREAAVLGRIASECKQRESGK